MLVEGVQAGGQHGGEAAQPAHRLRRQGPRVGAVDLQDGAHHGVRAEDRHADVGTDPAVPHGGQPGGARVGGGVGDDDGLGAGRARQPGLVRDLGVEADDPTDREPDGVGGERGELVQGRRRGRRLAAGDRLGGGRRHDRGHGRPT